MKIGDKVVADNQITEITAIAYDELGEKVYTVKGSTKDYYAEELKLIQMEEDIKILNNYLDGNDRKFVSLKRFKFLQAIENLINKYKEQKKIIDLMAEYISGTDKDEDICKKVGQNQLCGEYGENSKCKECLIEFFKEKAKGE